MTLLDTIDELQLAHGWSETDLLDFALKYIINQQDDAAFLAFLEQQCEQESHLTDDEMDALRAAVEADVDDLFPGNADKESDESGGLIITVSKRSLIEAYREHWYGAYWDRVQTILADYGKRLPITFELREDA